MIKRNFFRSVIKLSLCASIGLTAFTFASGNQAHAATETSLQLIDSGKEFIGTPYKYGAPAGITYAFDCSSFTQYIFDAMGVSLPRSSSSQASVGAKVTKENLSVGDLVFFNTSGRGISHVAIYAGDNKILHSATSTGVTISSLGESYWHKRYVTARRVLKS
ncbi:glycoside hydrolase [Paenibacillus sp. BIHB 4019]|uniref:Glycoside hydrolase n=1 Tax=Paenibacillus sp. BIHB 4019 TaxID=1870819 RepID=A0A1B2DL93_9BACL|nr:C40 family peptidase [Paenibacillus sp. BIHB 4019]ANY68490.1 glycoside hydrolase [Paenibacillus sp. BIHB 4019]